MPDPEASQAPDFEVIDGIAGFAEQAETLLSGARKSLDVLTQELDRRVYSTDSFLQAARKFVLQNPHVRMRILVHNPLKALAGGNRLIEFGRSLGTFVEFRELSAENKALVEEYLIADGRLLLHRMQPEHRTARLYKNAPHLARLKLKYFDPLWNEAQTVQEFRSLAV